ncbi:MAG: glycine oxidase ThiO [Gemmatimonadales bacterium]
MPVKPDVLIVGGGVVGTACARALALSGRQVAVIERGGGHGEAWRASAGLLAPQVEAKENDPLFDLGLAGRGFYEGLAGPLSASTGIAIGFYQGGSLQLAESEARAEELRSKVAWQRQQGHICDWLDEAEVRERWPWVGTSHGALWAPHDGSLHPERLVEALRADARRLGVTFIEDDVQRLERSGRRVTAATGRERHPAGEVVLAAGAWTGRIANLPRPVSVEPVRGQMVAFPWPRQAERVNLFGRGGYLLERDGEAISGATVEHAGFDPATTDEGIAVLSDRARLLVPALAGVATTRSWAGLRPGTPDGLPIIGREPNAQGLWYATGHGRSGLLLAGITGVLLERLMAGEQMTEEVDAVRPERFWGW